MSGCPAQGPDPGWAEEGVPLEGQPGSVSESQQDEEGTCRKVVTAGVMIAVGYIQGIDRTSKYIKDNGNQAL